MGLPSWSYIGDAAAIPDIINADVLRDTTSKQYAAVSEITGPQVTAALAADPTPKNAAAAAVSAALSGAGVLYGVSDMDPALTGYGFAAVDAEGKILVGDGQSGSSKWTETHLVVVLGQSNNTSYGQPLAAPLNTVHPNVFSIPQAGGLLNTITPAVDPLTFPRTGAPAGSGPSIGFAKRYADAHPGVRVVVVPLAKGGVPFRGDSAATGFTWAVDRHDVTNLFDEAVTRTNLAATIAAGVGPVSIGAVLWFQGETDSINGTSGTQYQADLDAMITAFRAQVPLAASAPFLIHQMVREFIEVRHVGTVDDVNAVLINTPARQPLTAFAYAPPLGYALVDNTHLNFTGQLLASEGYWKAWRRAVLNVTTQPISPPANVVLQQRGANVYATWDQPLTYHTSIELDFSKDDGATWTAVTHPVVMAAYETITAPGSGRTQVRVRAAVGGTKSAYAYGYINVV